MLVVPDYLAGATFNGTYFVTVPGDPDTALTVDSRKQPVVDLAFGASTNRTITGYGYTTYRVQVPGQFIVNPNWSVTNYVQTLTEITNSDTAVHSYALSASGPGQGYVTLIVGNGNVFTPPGAPVSVYVFP